MTRRVSLIRLVGALLCVVLVPGMASCAPFPPPSFVPTASTSTTPTPGQDPARLIFGTNMSLYDTNDQIVNSLATQQLLRQAHIPIIRVPSRSTLSDDYMLKALQAVRTIGALPLIIVHGADDPQALDDDRHLIALAQSVFGNATVYIEFGNEPDLGGIDAAHYTAAWNHVIPTLKAMAPTYKFVGPVTFQADPAYIAAFDAGADPLPDANSWHEYVCYPYSSDAYCLDHLASWTTDIQQTNAAVRAAIGTTVPVMITEWNLDAAPDARYASASFMATWMARAMATLRANTAHGLVAAMQYCATNNPHLSLIDSANNLTPEGRASFQLLAGADPVPLDGA